MGATRFIAGLFFMAACTATAGVAAAIGAAHAAGAELVLREGCQKGECTFTKIVATKTIGRNAAGYMLEVKSRSVVVPPKGDAATMPVPDNFGLVRVSYVFCSGQKPGIIYYRNERFYARLLTIGEAVAGQRVNLHIEYWAVCHKKVVSVADVTSDALAAEAGDLGYSGAIAGKRMQRKFNSRKKAFRFFGL